MVGGKMRQIMGSKVCMIIWYKKDLDFLCVQQAFTGMLKEDEKQY